MSPTTLQVCSAFRKFPFCHFAKRNKSKEDFLLLRKKANRKNRIQCLFRSEPFLTEAAASPAGTLAPPRPFCGNHTQLLRIQPRRFELCPRASLCFISIYFVNLLARCVLIASSLDTISPYRSFHRKTLYFWIVRETCISIA